MDTGVLKKFIYLFTTDASGVKKGAEDAEKSTKKLQDSLTATDVITNKLNQSFLGFAKRAGGFLLAMAGVGAVLHGIKSSIDIADDFDKLSEITGLAVEDLSAYSDAVVKAGGDTHGFLGSVKAISASMAEFATKGKSRVAPFFQELGIRMTDSRGKARQFLEVLPELADAFQKISKEESLGIGQKLGLDEGTIGLLQKGRKEVEELVRRERELGVFTKENASQAADFKDQWQDIQHIFRTISSQFSSVVLPILISVGKNIETLGLFIKNNSDLITGFLIAVGTAITVAVLPAVLGLVLAFAPFVGIAAIISAIGYAFALVYEDIQFFRRGQNSLLGEMVKKWPIIGDIFRNIGAAVSFLWDIFVGFISFINKAVTDPIEAWKEFKKVISTAFDHLLEKMPWLAKFLNFLGDKFSGIFKSIKDGIFSIFGFIESLISKIKGAIDTVANGYKKVKEFVGLGEGDSKSTNTAAQQRLADANNSPFNSRAVNSFANSSKALTRNTSVTTGPITINTQATDAEGVAKDLGNHLNKQIRQGMDYVSDGVQI